MEVSQDHTVDQWIVNVSHVDRNSVLTVVQRNLDHDNLDYDGDKLIMMMTNTLVIMIIL